MKRLFLLSSVIVLQCSGQQEPVKLVPKTVPVKPKPAPVRLEPVTTPQRALGPTIAAGKGLVLKPVTKPAPATAPVETILLVSSEGKEFKVPLDVALQSEQIMDHYRAQKKIGLKLEREEFPPMDNILSPEVAEVAQFMHMMHRYKNLSHDQLLEKADKEIEIRNPFAFTMAVKYLDFKPGIEFISQKYAKLRDYSFPKAEHEYWMKLIKEVNSVAYEVLKKCEAAASGKPCLEMVIDKDLDGIIKPGTEETHGYPILLLNPASKLFADESIQKKMILKPLLEKYVDAVAAFSITEKESKYILEFIKDLAPDLYKLIVAVDPTGANHILKYARGGRNASVVPSIKDGLPEIKITADFLLLPKNELLYVLGHELGHYILGHLQPTPPLAHKGLQTITTQKRILKKEGKKEGRPIEVMEQLPAEETFKKAFTRIQEFEADRFAVIEFEIPIDDAIANEKRTAEIGNERLRMRQQETFKRTHPFSLDRIKYLEELRREVELRKAQKRQPMKINWKDLADNYLQKWKQKYPALYQ